MVDEPVVVDAGATRRAGADVLGEVERRIGEGATDLVVDLEACPSLSVPALRSLSAATQDLRARGGTLTLTGVGPRLLHAIDDLGFAGSFTIANRVV